MEIKALREFKKVALDTNVFIYYYRQSPDFIFYADKVFTLLAENKLKAITSLLTLAELLSFKAPEGKIKELEDSFLGTPNLSIAPFDQVVAKDAARIRRVYNFRLPDAIQLATALRARVKVFITNDQRLSQFKELQIFSLSQL